MKRFRSYLAEGLSPILFHSTDINNITQILNTDRFRLTAVVGTDSDLAANAGKYYFMSFARSPASSYFNYYHANVNAYLEIDGRKLSNNYAGVSVDYWGREFKKDEMEDRLVTDKHEIPRASSYIRAIHVCLPLERETVNMFDRQRMFNAGVDADAYEKNLPFTVALSTMEDERKRRFREMIIAAHRRKIAVYFYDDMKEFIARRNPIELDVSMLAPIEAKPSVFDVGGGWSPRKYPNSFGPWLELVYAKDYSKLSDDAKNILYRFRHYPDEAIRSLKNEIHNTKTKPISKSIVDAFHVTKSRSVEEFLEKLGAKWKDYE